MFWGLIMEPNKRYSQTVEKAFHVSMATLDDGTADDGVVQVMACYEGRNYLLCNLKKGLQWQVGLDLNFDEGTTIAFTSNGRGHVHLTGYVLPDSSDMSEIDEEEDDIEEEEEDEVEDEEVIPQLIGKVDKRKAKASPENAKQAKRQKAAEPESSDDEDDLEDEENSEMNETTELEGSDDEEEASNEDEDSEEEEEVPAPQPVGKKNKQKQQQQQQPQQQQQQNNQKAQKQKNLVNGKEAKQQQQKATESTNEQAQKKRVISGGVQIEEIKVGNGAPAKSGKFVTVYYVGRLKNGKKFDSTTNGEGFKFRLGKGEVIKGWDVGIQGMKIGGKRRLTIPPGMGYGAKGSPPVIPGSSTLVFEVELKNVH